MTTHRLPQTTPARLLALGPAATTVALLAFFALLLLMYLAQSTQGATRQYDVRNLEEEITTLKQDREQLELESVRLQSLKEVMPPSPEPAEPAETDSSSPPPPELAPAVKLNALPTHRSVVTR